MARIEYDPGILDGVDADSPESVLNDPMLLWGEFDPDFDIEQ